MLDNKIKPQTLLSTLWLFVLLNIIFRDLHEFLADGYIEKMMAMEIPESSLLFYGFVLEIPIAMVLLSRILNNKVNKWANVVAGSIILIGTLSSLPSADMDDVFFSTINIIAFLTIISVAWKLPIAATKRQVLVGK